MDVLLTQKKRIGLVIIILMTLLWIGIGFILDLEETVDHPNDHSPSTVLQMADEISHLHIFAQVSDLHLSIYKDKKRGPDLKKFLTKTIPLLSPEVLIISGDLTDAKYPDKEGSKQFEQEWKEYYQILEETKILEKTILLDLRGNHDAFDVPSLNSKENYFREYSYRGRNHSKAYRYVHRTTDGDSFSFVAFDACPDPGPRRPFNFFGVATQADLDELKLYAERSQEQDMTVFFGHFPTSVVTGDLHQLRSILSQGSVYLPGHLHTLHNIVPNLYAYHQDGFLELEVGDWMDNRRYRVFVVDHGLFSLSDQNHEQWPIVVITNPKNNQLLLPEKEPIAQMLHSTHIRMVVFSDADILSVDVEIDDVSVGQARHREGPLYTLPWEPHPYSEGTHTITVTVKDSKGRVNITRQPFSLDGTRTQFSLLQRFLLMSHHHLVVKTIFIMIFIGTVLPLVVMKVVNISVGVEANNKPRCRCMILVIQFFLRRYKLICNSPSVFWPLILFHFYIALGPWFIGEIMTGHIGAMFVFGLFVQSTFIPGSLTFLYGSFQMLLFNLPLTIYLGHVLDHRMCSHKRPYNISTQLPRACRWLLHHGPFFLFVSYQLYLVSGFYRAYGLMAALLCPVRTWSVPFALILRQVAMGKRKFSFHLVEKVQDESETSARDEQ